MEGYYNLSSDELQAMLNAAAKKAVAEYAGEKKPNLLSRQATAKRLNVNVSTLWRWEKYKVLTPVRIGGKVYYREEDVIRREGGFIPEL
ncbi:MAG: helix-turn-helix domain-containing protein [Bacteroidales bacterium]|nr:helix-turn-helix domain-containing protein [Bacteroidales bacterium]